MLTAVRYWESVQAPVLELYLPSRACCFRAKLIRSCEHKHVGAAPLHSLSQTKPRLGCRFALSNNWQSGNNLTSTLAMYATRFPKTPMNALYLPL